MLLSAAAGIVLVQAARSSSTAARQLRSTQLPKWGFPLHEALVIPLVAPVTAPHRWLTGGDDDESA